jgi:hypothetical protein
VLQGFFAFCGAFLRQGISLLIPSYTAFFRVICSKIAVNRGEKAVFTANIPVIRCGAKEKW